MAALFAVRCEKPGVVTLKGEARECESTSYCEPCGLGHAFRKRLQKGGAPGRFSANQGAVASRIRRHAVGF